MVMDVIKMGFSFAADIREMNVFYLLPFTQVVYVDVRYTCSWTWTTCSYFACIRMRWSISLYGRLGRSLCVEVGYIWWRLLLLSCRRVAPLYIMDTLDSSWRGLVLGRYCSFNAAFKSFVLCYSVLITLIRRTICCRRFISLHYHYVH